MTAVMPYNKKHSAHTNVKRLLKKMDVSMAEFVRSHDIDPSTLSYTVLKAFKSETGKPSKIGDKVKGILSPYFIGGIPDNTLKEDAKSRTDLFDLFGCKDCEFRMRSQEGCFKFGHSKREINHGAFVITREHGAYHLSETKRCPYAN